MIASVAETLLIRCAFLFAVILIIVVYCTEWVGPARRLFGLGKNLFSCRTRYEPLKPIGSTILDVSLHVSLQHFAVFLLPPRIQPVGTYKGINTTIIIYQSLTPSVDNAFKKHPCESGIRPAGLSRLYTLAGTLAVSRYRPGLLLVMTLYADVFCCVSADEAAEQIDILYISTIVWIMAGGTFDTALTTD